MLKTQAIWKELRELHFSICASIEHGEHFYEGGERLQRFLDRVEKLKELSLAYHEAIKEEEE